MPIEFKGMEYVDPDRIDEMPIDRNDNPELHILIRKAKLGETFGLNLGPDATRKEVESIRNRYYHPRNQEKLGFGIKSNKRIDKHGNVWLFITKHPYVPDTRKTDR